MSYDLFVYTGRAVDEGGLAAALDDKCRLYTDDPADTADPSAHEGGAFPVCVLWRGGEYDEAPELYSATVSATELEAELEDAPRRHRSNLRKATHAYTICGDDDPGSWALAAGLCDAGSGVIVDPQDNRYYTSRGAWKRFSSSCKDTYADLAPPPHATAEQRFLARLVERHPGTTPDDWQTDLEFWRREQREKRQKKLLHPLMQDNDVTRLRRLVGHPEVSVDDLHDLLKYAFTKGDAARAREIVGAAAAARLVELAHRIFYSTGVSSRLYIEFLMAAGLHERIPTDARPGLLARCADRDIRNVVSAQFADND